MVSYQIERLINFALNKNLISERDVTATRNSLLDLLKVSEPYSFSEGEIIDETISTATEILEPILDYCAEKGILPENTLTYRDLMDARIMGLFMPRSSEVNREFFKLYEQNKESATDYFYVLSQNSNYIQTDRIKKNLYWTTPTKFGDLEITINLSKPEKDPKEIAAAKSAPQTNYPKCLLCRENEGFAGGLNHPARQNLRLVPLTLNNEDWFMQYSPYVYYNEHCIVLHKDHIPMKITEETFRRLLDFVEILPHYMIGSNTDIPIVGGSILTHDHYQGGRHTFPMAKAVSILDFAHEDYSGMNISIIKWPLSVIRISGKDEEALVRLSNFILNKWKNYSDESADILAFTGDTPHNAITPIARINSDNLYELDLALRNNRTSDEHPLGIFHPHSELHHIKKENIGLIEVMGLAILPGRLNSELDSISDILCSKSQYNENEFSQPEHPLNKHLEWIKELISRYGLKNTKEDATEILRNEVGLIFSKVLQDAGVYKYNESGKIQFGKFMKHCGFEQLLKN